MSGGSYNYLCFAEGSELFDKIEQLDAMAKRLGDLGYADDAAGETLELLLTIKQYERLASAITRRLSDVWRAVEWWDSADSSEDGVKEALEEYRK